MKLQNALEGYWLEKRIDFSKMTEKKYNYVFQRFVTFVGECTIEEITATDIKRFLESLRTQHEKGQGKQLSKRSIHDNWAVLSSLWAWAEKELEIPNVIKNKVYAPGYEEKVIEPYSQDDVKRLLKATENTKDGDKRGTATRDKAIIAALLDTGIRASEICSLKIEDYDTHKGRFHIKHGKGDKERYAPLGSRSQKALWRYLATRPDAKPKAPLFASRDNRHMRRESLYHLIEKFGLRSGVTGVFVHRFRHTFAIEFLRNGGNVVVLQELLGHEKLETVMKYIRLAERDIDGSVRHSPADNWNL